MSKEQVVLVVPSAIKAWLKAQAVAESRSVNFIATGLLQKAMDTAKGSVA